MSAEVPEPHALYADGLESLIGLLERVRDLAEAQRTASRERDLPRFTALANERDVLTSTIVMLDARLAPLRARLSLPAVSAGETASSDSPARRAGLVDAHRTARALVDGILAVDRETHAFLEDADAARRTLAQTLEAGEQTLAAYRRAISPNRTSALIDARS